jgi:hypothetical protein
LTFSGSSGFSLGTNATIVSDFAALSIGPSSVPVVTCDDTSGNPGRVTVPGGQVGTFSKAATTSWNVAAPTGAWTQGAFYMVSKVEAQ